MTKGWLSLSLLPAGSLMVAGMPMLGHTDRAAASPFNEAALLATSGRGDGFGFRGRLGKVVDEANTDRWVAIGGSGPTLERQRRLLLNLASAPARFRQDARFDYARFLVVTGRALEGSAVLDVMTQDEPDLAADPAFTVVRAIADIGAGRYSAAEEKLGLPELTTESDACLWRSLAAANADDPQGAIVNWPCAIAAANRQVGHQRVAFARAILRAAYLRREPALASEIFLRISGDDPEISFWRAMFALRGGQADFGMRLLSELRDRSGTVLAGRAELELVKAQLRNGRISTRAAVARLDKLRFVARGGPFERDLLITLSAFEEQQGNLRGALASSAPLIRYFDLGSETSTAIARGQRLIQAAFDPQSQLSVIDQAGIYWDYRDLAPQGAAGDDLVRRLAERLAAAGLQRRAADLLERQVEARLQDAAPAVAVRIAEWRLLAGEPERALKILADTRDGVLPRDIEQQRQLLSLYALLGLGRTGEAVAIAESKRSVLSSADRASIYWECGEWGKFIAMNGSTLKNGKAPLGDEGSARVVRQAIAAAILRDEGELKRLSVRYGPQFSGSGKAFGTAFHLLTSGAPVEQSSIQRALADIDHAAPEDPALGWVHVLMQSQGR